MDTDGAVDDRVAAAAVVVEGAADTGPHGRVAGQLEQPRVPTGDRGPVGGGGGGDGRVVGLEPGDRDQHPGEIQGDGAGEVQLGGVGDVGERGREPGHGRPVEAAPGRDGRAGGVVGRLVEQELDAGDVEDDRVEADEVAGEALDLDAGVGDAGRDDAAARGGGADRRERDRGGGRVDTDGAVDDRVAAAAVVVEGAADTGPDGRVAGQLEQPRVPTGDRGPVGGGGGGDGRVVGREPGDRDQHPGQIQGDGAGEVQLGGVGDVGERGREPGHGRPVEAAPGRDGRAGGVVGRLVEQELDAGDVEDDRVEADEVAGEALDLDAGVGDAGRDDAAARGGGADRRERDRGGGRVDTDGAVDDRVAAAAVVVEGAADTGPARSGCRSAGTATRPHR